MKYRVRVAMPEPGMRVKKLPEPEAARIKNIVTG
jgi:hypothetical protein